MSWLYSSFKYVFWFFWSIIAFLGLVESTSVVSWPYVFRLLSLHSMMSWIYLFDRIFFITSLCELLDDTFLLSTISKIPGIPVPELMNPFELIIPAPNPIGILYSGENQVIYISCEVFLFSYEQFAVQL
jgi:hypothetical protein